MLNQKWLASLLHYKRFQEIVFDVSVPFAPRIQVLRST